jgi:hypothetical protein
MESVKKYLVYRISDGTCINVVLWDGESPFNPGEGLALEMIPAGSSAWIGWKRHKEGEWIEPIVEEEII